MSMLNVNISQASLGSKHYYDPKEGHFHIFARELCLLRGQETREAHSAWIPDFFAQIYVVFALLSS